MSEIKRPGKGNHNVRHRKLTAADVEQIRKYIAEGHKRRDIAARYGVGTQNIANALQRYAAEKLSEFAVVP